jgi:hypothetical protein
MKLASLTLIGFIAVALVGCGKNEGKNSVQATVPVQTIVNSNPVAEWVEVFKNDGISAYYVKPSSIHRIGNKLKVLVLEDLDIAENDGSFSVIWNTEFDCSNARSRRIGVKTFSGHKGSGNILFEGTKIYEWEPVEPDTVSYELHKFSCKEQNQREVSSASVAPRGNSFMDKVANTVANNEVEKYEITRRNGNPVDICVQAMMVSAAYLQAKDESNYQRWKQTQSADCARAGMPQ